MVLCYPVLRLRKYKAVQHYHFDCRLSSLLNIDVPFNITQVAKKQTLLMTSGSLHCMTWGSLTYSVTRTSRLCGSNYKLIYENAM